MGRWSKGIISRLNNFRKDKNTLTPLVEHDFDEIEEMDSDEDFQDLEHGHFLLDKGNSHEEDTEDSDSDSSDEELDKEELTELQKEADLEHFRTILTHAQAMAVKAECEAAGKKPKRKRHYAGNSDRTKWDHAQKHRKLEVTGQKLISSMFTKAEKFELKEPAAEVEEANHPIIDTFNDSDLDDGNEIETSLKDSELFPQADEQLTQRVEELLRQLQEGRCPQDYSPETITDQILNKLSHKDFGSLRSAWAELTVKAKDKKLDVFFFRVAS